MHKLLLTWLALTSLSLLVSGCGEVDTADPADQVDAATSTDVTPSACTARVVIAFYSDANCTAQVGMRSYDTAQPCFSWTAAGSNAQENSASHFQCYRDRLCYTQFPNSLTCGDGGIGSTDKEAKVGACIKEPAGSLYSKVLSGTEACPEAPAGFECPLSAAGAGSTGVVACS
jgi:hypothetical protein